MAPFTTSRLGSTINTKDATPIVCNVSIPQTTIKSFRGGRRHDLKKHILNDLIKVPNSGTKKANSRHQVQATRSSGGKFTTYCLSRPVTEMVKLRMLIADNSSNKRVCDALCQCKNSYEKSQLSRLLTVKTFSLWTSLVLLDVVDIKYHFKFSSIFLWVITQTHYVIFFKFNEF